MANKIPFLQTFYNILYPFRFCPELSYFSFLNNQSFNFRAKLLSFFLNKNTSSLVQFVKVVKNEQIYK